MKKTFFLLTASLLTNALLFAQPPGRPDQPRYTVPKAETGKPQNPKLTAITFEQTLDDASWKGVRFWSANNAATVDSITTLSFFLQRKQVTWTKQGWEAVTSKPGTYTINGNKIIIQFSYPPYTHYLDGTYDAASKKITGTFREDRAVMTNPPPAYQPGTTSGEFVLIQK